MQRFKRLFATVLLVFGICGGIVVTADTAGATYYDGHANMTCGYTPPAPNAIDTCSTWQPSQFWGYPYSYKIDATHHYGWWGSSFDPGTWHVIVYLYHNGNLLGQVMNMDIGDWAFPTAFANPNKGAVTFKPTWTSNFTVYRGCSASGVVKDVYFSDTANYGWAQGYSWPYGNDLYGGTCQHGFGSHGSAVRINPNALSQLVSGVTITYQYAEFA